MTLQAKNLGTPDEKHSFDHGDLNVVNLTGMTIVRAAFNPGWRWSTDVKPLVGTESCQVSHAGYVVSGRLHVRLDDGREYELGPGDAHVVSPGHDAWVVGEEPFVAVDFARDSLADALARSGHDADAPSFWLWEGVTPYLPIQAIRSTLEAVASRSARTSRIAVTYGTPRGSPFGQPAMRVARFAFRAIGEELLGLLEPEAMRAELGRVGYSVLEDLSAVEWGERFGGGRSRLLLVDERLAVAVSDGPPRASRAA